LNPKYIPSLTASYDPINIPHATPACPNIHGNQHIENIANNSKESSKYKRKLTLSISHSFIALSIST
jgi:hypothetical protein